MKTLAKSLLLGILVFAPFSLSVKTFAREASPNLIRGNYSEAAWLANQLAKQAESLSYRDPYNRPGEIYDSNFYPGPRRPRTNPTEIRYAAKELQDSAMDLYYTLRFLERSGGRGDESQIFRNFRSVRKYYQRLSYVAPHWKMNRISDTYQRLERALYGYRDRW
ncbi:MAG: hypothetical protein AB8G05_27185 [Oligoflexales bacterium]